MEGLSMSDASKKVSEMFSDRNDGISKNTMSQFLSRLSDAQEQLKAEKVQKLQETIALNNQYPDETLEGQMPPEAQQFQEQLQMGQPIQQPAPDGLGTMGQQQMDNGGYQQQGWLGTTPGAGMQANSGVAVGNAAGATSGIMGLVDQASGNTSPDTGKSVLTGAVSGAAVGTMIFPGIGTAIGAGVGAIAGYAGAKGAQKKVIKQTNNAAMNYNAQFQEQYADGGILGAGMLKNNVYGGYGNNKPQQPFYGFPINGQLMNPFKSNTTQGVVDEVQYYASQNPIMNAQNYLTSNNYNLTGGADGKWGPSSQKNLDAWRKAQGINATGPLSATDYQAMGYNPQGYTPFDNTELEGVVINANRAQTPSTFATSEVPVTSTITPPEDPAKKPNFDYNNLLRHMTPLGNALQLGSLQEPQMGNLNQDLTRARRDYIDENTMARNIRNQGNTLNRSIQGSGMTEGARRASMLASGLNTQEALGNAFIQAQQANRQVDQVADQLDAQTRQSNQRNRMLADENYARDKGAYNTEKSKLTAQMFTDIGNIGLEGSRTNKIEKITGYTVNGDYIKNDKTGESYNSSELTTKIEQGRKELASASTEHAKKVKQAEINKWIAMQNQIKEALTPKTTSSQPKTNKK